MRREIRVAAAVLLGVLFAAVALYRVGTAFETDRSPQRPIAAAETPERTASTVPDAAAISFWNKPRALPDLQFADGDGRPVTLKALQGRPILLNIWAPWCIPCRQEMPALDRLQAEIGTSHLLVLPLSIDRRGLPAVRKFYEDKRLTSLGIYIDQSGEAASEIDNVGVPMTLLIDRDGREVGRRIGALEWDGPKIVALIRQHLGLPQ